MISCFISFWLDYWFPIDSSVFIIDSVIGESSLFFSFSPPDENCFSSYRFRSWNFFCLFSLRIFFMWFSVLSDFYGEIRFGEMPSGLLLF
jgi:hypothetical protein